MDNKDQSKQPPLAGVIGCPIDHSLSPYIHRYWAEREGENAHYIPIYISDDDAAFKNKIEHIKALGFSGVNVTLPHKERAFKIADHKTDRATAAGAANMLSFTNDRIVADNSDIIGFEMALRQSPITDYTSKTALVLGAGGAARGVLYALENIGLKKIILANRTLEKAMFLAKGYDQVDTVEWSGASAVIPDSDIVINTTSLGMKGNPPLDLALDHAPKDSVICDIVYNPLKTALLEQAQDRHLFTIDGLAMLMHQAVPGYQQWLGKNAVVDDDLRAVLVSILNKRASA